MFTQHLTVAQSKHLFVSKDCFAYRCDEGLNPADVSRSDLRPLVVATLSVERLGIYWQRLYFADEPVPLASFLYLAWTEYHTLGGMPECLLVEPELFGAYPLRHVLGQLDPDRVIRKLESGEGRFFGATKKNSQGLVKHCIEAGNFSQDSISHLPNQQAVLARLNHCLESYHRIWQFSPKPGMKLRNSEFQEHLSRAVSLPHWPHDLLVLNTEDWMRSQADAILLMNPEDDLYFVPNTEWSGFIFKRWIPQQEPPQFSGLCTAQRTVVCPPCFSPDLLYWANDMLDFTSLVNSLPFSPGELFKTLIKEELLHEFLSGREPIPGVVADRLVSFLYESSERMGLVVFPGTVGVFSEALILLGHGGDERCCAELVCGQNGAFPYRVFALDDDAWLSLLIVRRGSVADSPELSSMLHQTLGEVDVGVQGFAAIHFWLEHLIQGTSRANSLSLLGMVEAMLSTIPRWVEADRPADHLMA